MNHLGSSIAVARTAGHRQKLALLYTDLSRSSSLAATLEPEVFRALLLSLRRIWQDCATRFGGRLVLAQGDGGLIAFGLERPGEDDARHAVEAALDIHARVAGLTVEGLTAAQRPLSMHSGVVAGLVLVSDGAPEIGSHDLSGETTSLAKQLSDAAGPGEILTTQATLGPHGHCFALCEPGAQQLSAADPALRRQALLVRGPGPAHNRFEATARRGMTPFIGRSGLLQTLVDFVVDPRSDGPRCVVTEGGPGLGKTRLIEQLLQHPALAGQPQLRGGCERDLSAELLQPFVQMLRTTQGAVDSASASATGLRRAAAALAAGCGDEGLQPRLREALDLLGGRLLLVVDDWQWADDASRQVLQSLLGAPGADGLRVLLAARPRDDGGHWVADAPHFTLPPFDAAESAVVVQQRLPAADPFLAARIHDYAGGVPLYVEELCHSAAVDGLPDALGRRQATQGWLATLVVSRLGRLPPEQAAVVRAASVVGNQVPLPLLAAACGGRPPSPAVLRALADADFLRGEPQGEVLQFKHGITRDAVYESVGLQERTALHRAVEAALRVQLDATRRPDEAAELQESLARHARGAGHWPEAARHAEQAGDRAMAAFAIDHARQHYLAAMHALDRMVETTPEVSAHWCLLVTKLGMTSIFDPLALDNELTDFERAVSLASQLGDAGLHARTVYWLAYTCYGYGRFRLAVAHARRALAMAQSSADQRLAAQVEAMLGQALVAASQYDEALGLMDAAVDAKKRGARPGSGIAIGSAYTLACKGSVLADRGAFAAAHACFGEAFALLQGSSHPVSNSSRNWMAVSLVWQGRWDDVQRITGESLRIAVNTRALLLLVVCQAAGGFARWRANRDPQGLQQLRAAVQWMDARGGRFYTSLYNGWLAEALLCEGDRAGARRHALRALARTREGERLGEAPSARVLCALAVAAGRVPAAQRWLARAQASAGLRASRREAALNLLAEAGLQRHLGRAGDAERCEAVAIAELRALDMAWHAHHASALSREGWSSG